MRSIHYFLILYGMENLRE